jgi:hypothetical protein
MCTAITKNKYPGKREKETQEIKAAIYSIRVIYTYYARKSERETQEIKEAILWYMDMSFIIFCKKIVCTIY